LFTSGDDSTSDPIDAGECGKLIFGEDNDEERERNFCLEYRTDGGRRDVDDAGRGERLL
jgi:hypothetical protein